jgi:hypothetical protein
VHRRSGDLKWRGRRPSQSRRTTRRRVHRGDYYRFMKRHLNRTERRRARIELRLGHEPFPHQPRNRVLWEM